MRLNEQKLEASRNFANKLWNAARFVVSNLQNASGLEGWDDLGELSHREDRWIVSRLNRVAAQVDTHMRGYQFGEAQREVHDFLWNEYCDWYIEMSKIRLRSGSEPSPLPVLAHVLEKTLRLLHPFLPFVTEEIWTRLLDALPDSPDQPDALIIAPYPMADESRFDDKAEAEVGSVIELVRSVRNLRAEFRVQNSDRLSAGFSVSQGRENVFDESLPFIQSEAKIDLSLSGPSAGAAKSSEAVQVLRAGTLTLDLGGTVDLDNELERLRSELADLEKYSQRLSRNLANESFVNRAPEEVVDRERERLSGTQDRIGLLTDLLDRLGG